MAHSVSFKIKKVVYVGAESEGDEQGGRKTRKRLSMLDEVLKDGKKMQIEVVYGGSREYSSVARVSRGEHAVTQNVHVGPDGRIVEEDGERETEIQHAAVIQFSPDDPSMVFPLEYVRKRDAQRVTISLLSSGRKQRTLASAVVSLGNLPCPKPGTLSLFFNECGTRMRVTLSACVWCRRWKRPSSKLVDPNEKAFGYVPVPDTHTVRVPLDDM